MKVRHKGKNPNPVSANIKNFPLVSMHFDINSPVG